MTTETHNTHPGDHAPQPLALKSNSVLGPCSYKCEAWPECGCADELHCGPWSVSMLERPQLRPYYVCRQVSHTAWEQLRDSEGGIARFETMIEAQEAADAENSARA